MTFEPFEEMLQAGNLVKMTFYANAWNTEAWRNGLHIVLDKIVEWDDRTVTYYVLYNVDRKRKYKVPELDIRTVEVISDGT